MASAKSLIASVGLIGGVCLGTLVPAIAATPDPGTGGSGATAPQYQAPPTNGPVQQARGRVPVHSVAVLQEALNSVGANIRVDGIRGPATEAALRHYQQQNGLQITGELDQATRARLDPIG
jgi:peptidoglycan hydrolase-like protein with peptidoglycan-binding domain